MRIFKKRVNEFPTPYTCTKAIREGGLETKLSMVLMGLGNMVHGQIVKGLLYLAVEVAYIVFMAVNGAGFLAMLPSLGSVPQKEIWDEAQQIYVYTKGGSVHPDPAVRRGDRGYYFPHDMRMARRVKERI